MDSWDSWGSQGWQEARSKLFRQSLEALLQAAENVRKADEGAEYPELVELVPKVTKHVPNSQNATYQASAGAGAPVLDPKEEGHARASDSNAHGE